jgi:hypothetical protein
VSAQSHEWRNLSRPTICHVLAVLALGMGPAAAFLPWGAAYGYPNTKLGQPAVAISGCPLSTWRLSIEFSVIAPGQRCYARPVALSTGAAS